MAPAFFRTMELEHLVMKTEEEYINFAIELADPAKRKVFSDLLKERVPRIWRDEEYVLDWGRFFKRAISSLQFTPSAEHNWIIEERKIELPSPATHNDGNLQSGNVAAVSNGQESSLNYEPAIQALVRVAALCIFNTLPP